MHNTAAQFSVKRDVSSQINQLYRQFSELKSKIEYSAEEEDKAWSPKQGSSGKVNRQRQKQPEAEVTVAEPTQELYKIHRCKKQTVEFERRLFPSAHILDESKPAATVEEMTSLYNSPRLELTTAINQFLQSRADVQDTKAAMIQIFKGVLKDQVSKLGESLFRTLVYWRQNFQFLVRRLQHIDEAMKQYLLIRNCRLASPVADLSFVARLMTLQAKYESEIVKIKKLYEDRIEQLQARNYNQERCFQDSQLMYMQEVEQIKRLFEQSKRFIETKEELINNLSQQNTRIKEELKNLSRLGSKAKTCKGQLTDQDEFNNVLSSSQINLSRLHDDQQDLQLTQSLIKAQPQDTVVQSCQAKVHDR